LSRRGRRQHSGARRFAAIRQARTAAFLAAVFALRRCFEDAARRSAASSPPVQGMLKACFGTWAWMGWTIAAAAPFGHFFFFSGQ
jgi:hypothetical protein